MKARSRLLAIGAPLLIVLAASCGGQDSGAPPEAYRGTIRSSCAPHDAPSAELRLESIEGPGWAWFNLWPEGGVVPPTVVRFDDDRPIGQGTYCSVEACEPAEAAEWGEVVLLSDSETGVRGEWTLGMANGLVHRGRFEAEWLAIQALCG